MVSLFTHQLTLEKNRKEETDTNILSDFYAQD